MRTACRSAGVSDATHYNWRRRFGGTGKSQLSELPGLEKENDEPLERHWSERQWRMLKKIVADLQFDKLILKESLNYLKPRA